MLPWGKKYEAVKRAEEHLRECCAALGLGEKTIGKSGRDWIGRRRWEGNPGELRRLVYIAALTCPGKEIEAGHFPPRRRRDHEAHAKAQFEGLSLEEILRHKVAHFFSRLGDVEVKGVYGAVMEQVERPLIEECVRWAGGNRLKAARVLGISRNTLRKKMQEHSVK